MLDFALNSVTRSIGVNRYTCVNQSCDELIVLCDDGLFVLVMALYRG